MRERDAPLSWPGPPSVTTCKSVRIEDGAGWIDIDQAAADVTIDDRSGAISVSRIGANVSIDDGSGNISVLDLSGDLTLIDNASGRFRFSGIEGVIRDRS